MDAFDRKILRLLLRDSKLSYAQLAEHVNLSQSACFRRVQQLQNENVIESFTVNVNQAALGNTISAYAEVSVNRSKQADVETFKQVVRDSKNILSAHQLSGDTDFLLYITAADIESYTTFLENTILSLGAVRDVSSSIVLGEVKSFRAQI